METTKYDDHMIMSIGILKMKNKKYISEIEEIVIPSISREEMFESFLIETAFGNKIVKGSIVSSDYAKIVSGNAREIASRIEENNEAIKRISRKLALYAMSESDVSDLIARIEAYEGGAS